MLHQDFFFFFFWGGGGGGVGVNGMLYFYKGNLNSEVRFPLFSYLFS